MTLVFAAARGRIIAQNKTSSRTKRDKSFAPLITFEAHELPIIKLFLQLTAVWSSSGRQLGHLSSNPSVDVSRDAIELNRTNPKTVKSVF